MTHTLAFRFAVVILVVACAGPGIAQTATQSASASAPAIPEAVNGWREYPLRDGVISIQSAKWRTDKVLVPVQAGKGLEYKLTMKKGAGLVYNISYGALSDPQLMI